MDLTNADQNDVNENVHAFEAAVSAQKTALTEPTIERLLVAVDGSNQDETTIGLAGAIARSHGAAVRVAYAPEGEAQPGDDLIDVRVRALKEAGVTAEAIETDHARRSFDQILWAADETGAQMIVVDAPYLDDYESLGGASVGTNLQMLMSKSRVPLLVVREPLDDPVECLAHVLLGVTLHRVENRPAAEWSLALLKGGQELRVLAVVDREALHHVELDPGEELDLADTDPEFLAGVRGPNIAGLIAAVQREAVARSLGCRVSVRTGEIVPAMSDFANHITRIVVAACPRDPAHGAYQRVEGLIRASKNPVLVV